jgi:hypothetical protein
LTRLARVWHGLPTLIDHTPQETPVRKLLALVGLVTVATAIVAPAASAGSRCYTLGVPGFDHYEYCTHLPVDPELR